MGMSPPFIRLIVEVEWYHPLTGHDRLMKLSIGAFKMKIFRIHRPERDDWHTATRANQPVWIGRQSREDDACSYQ